MVGVGVAEGAGAPPEPYYGEYFPPEPYYVQEMCPHPQQHPQHAHMCTVHTEYGGMPVVTSGTMMPQMMQPVLDENLRHYLVAHHHQPHPHHQPPHHTPHHQPPHHQPPPPPHHQPPHHYGQPNGAAGGPGPQHFYNAGYGPHYHLPPHHMPHFQPPPVYQKDERTQRQYSKLKQKLDRKQQQHSRNNGSAEANSGASTPSLSPRKELNGGGSRGASSGAWSEGEGSSAGASLRGEEEDTQAALDQLAAQREPQVSEITPTSALVQWNSPLPEGVPAPPVDLTYDLLLGDRGRHKAIYSGPKLSCRVCDLRPGCEYSVRLQIRAGDAGATSEEVTFRAPPAPPAAPAAPKVTQRARTSLTLRWPAAVDNGARITHYILEADSGEGWTELARPRTKQHSASDLRPQTRYRFRVSAVNACGRGAWSEEGAAWTLGAPPPAPRPPRLVDAAPDRLALAWERRAPDHDYTLQCDDPHHAHGFLPVYSGPDESHVCTGLRRATDYRFRLRCETADGQGPWSPEVTYRTPAERPGAPPRPALRGKAHSRAFRLRWEPPADDGGAPPHTYTLQLDAGDGFRDAYSGPEREATCDRLRPGAAYRARVCAANVAGVGDWSAPETLATEPAPPAAPPAPALVLRAAPLVRWRPPPCTGGAPLTEYRLELLADGAAPRLAYAGLDTECVLRDLAPGRAYRLALCAVNRVGAGPACPPLAFTAPAAPPAAPALAVPAHPSPRAARLAWTAPPDNGAPVLDYRLEMSSSNADDTFAEVFRGLATEHVVENLTPFSAYFFRVCARNAAGRGAWSETRDTLTPRAPPAAPAPPRVEAGATWLRLTWAAPAAHGAAVTQYLVRLGDTELEAGATPERLLEGLAPDTEYSVRVAAVSALGAGDWSEPRRAATRPPPPAPPRLACAQAAHNYLKIKWDADTPAPDDAHYRLEMRAPDSRDFRPVYRGSARFFKAKKLREASVYAFRIRASDERGGRGEWSAPLEARTSAAPPAAPRAPSVEPAGGGRALVAWDGPEDGLTVYRVQLAGGRAGGAWRAAWAGGAARCTLEELEPGGEYSVRVCAERGGLAGAWSPVSRLALPAAARAQRTARPARPRRLRARHAALLMAGGFLVLAVLVAVVLQRLVEPRP